MKIVPQHSNPIKYWVQNYDEGYNFGVRDASLKRDYCNNFTLEKHGFMTGYLHGYCSKSEQHKGKHVADRIMYEFMKKIESGEVLPENDRSADTQEDQEKYWKKGIK